jgi:hypothetical protein
VRFKAFKSFTEATDIKDYLKNQLAASIKDMVWGLTKLSFLDNFESFQVEVEIPRYSEVTIRNKIQQIPSGYLILRQSGNGVIIDGDTPWTNQLVYLKNTAGLDASVKVIFLR